MVPPKPFHYEPMNRFLAYDRWTLLPDPDGHHLVRLEEMVRAWSMREVCHRARFWEVPDFMRDEKYFGTAVRAKLQKELEDLDAKRA